MTAVKVWKSGESGQPTFPQEFTVVQNAVLQVTDLKSNHNKFYALELHAAGQSNVKHACRLFTHYGRTDDLDLNPEAGQKECRYFTSVEEARLAYESLYREKTGPRKGYRELSLASSRIGSDKSRGQKQETLQLMKDMLQINGDRGSILFDSKVEQQYRSLNCDLACLDPAADEYRRLENHVTGGRQKCGHWSIDVKNIFKVRRPPEWEQFTSSTDNHQLLFHGSRIQNWVGILSRGILLPKVVVNLGVRRTDAGWLGNGIYFGDAASTSCAYTSPGRNGRGTRMMALATVALGRVRDYTRITYGLSAPPEGCHSCHGVKGTLLRQSQFADDEYVIYDPRQHRVEYLIEFTA